MKQKAKLTFRFRLNKFINVYKQLTRLIMKMNILVAVFISLLLLSCKDKITNTPDGSSTKPPAIQPPATQNDYFPLKVGNTWFYNLSGGGGDPRPGGSSTSWRGTVKWTVNSYNSGIYNIKEELTNFSMDTTVVGYFTISKIDSNRILLGSNSIFKDTLIRYCNLTEPDTLEYSTVRFGPLDVFYKLKKDTGVIYYHEGTFHMTFYYYKTAELVSFTPGK